MTGAEGGRRSAARECWGSIDSCGSSFQQIRRDAGRDFRAARHGHPLPEKTFHGFRERLAEARVDGPALPRRDDARVALDQRAILVDGHEVKLQPGMAVTVEIRTGQRRAIDFLLAPLREIQASALRER